MRQDKEIKPYTEQGVRMKQKLSEGSELGSEPEVGSTKWDL